VHGKCNLTSRGQGHSGQASNVRGTQCTISDEQLVLLSLNLAVTFYTRR